MIDPVESNSVREILLKFAADEQGDMTVSINATGFEDDPNAVGLYLSAVMSTISDTGDEPVQV